MNNLEKKKIFLPIVAVILLLIAIIGVTYAIFLYTREGEQENVINTGTITMSYNESDTNVITIYNAMPTSDEVGMIQTDYFDFNLSSTIAGTATINYEIWSKSISVDNELPHTDVKVYLEKLNGGIYEEVVEPILYNETDEKGMLLYKGSFINDTNKKVNFRDDYRFRMWIKEDAILEQEEKSFKLKINVYAAA